MAGLFGLFDVTREGPGVSKDAPRKRDFVVFFEVLGRKFWHLMIAGLLFAVVNLPLITRGWADAGLTFVTRAFSRQKHAFVKDDFFATVRKNRKQAFWVGFINFLVTALLFYNITYYMFGLYPELYQLFGRDITGLTAIQPTLVDYLVMGCTFVGYILFTFMKYYIPFLMITFDLSLKKLYYNAMLFAMGGLKENLLISAVLIVVYAGMFLLASLDNLITYLLVMLLWLVALPALRSYLIQFTIFPLVRRLMIDPYYEQHPEADKQQRRDLNLDVEEAPVGEDAAAPAAPTAEEPVFSDSAPVTREPSAIPRQYSERELRRFNQKRSHSAADDDDTI